MTIGTDVEAFAGKDMTSVNCLGQFLMSAFPKIFSSSSMWKELVLFKVFGSFLKLWMVKK